MLGNRGTEGLAERYKLPQRVRAEPESQTVLAMFCPQKKAIRGPNLSY